MAGGQFNGGRVGERSEQVLYKFIVLLSSLTPIALPLIPVPTFFTIVVSSKEKVRGRDRFCAENTQPLTPQNHSRGHIIIPLPILEHLIRYLCLNVPDFLCVAQLHFLAER